MVHLALQLFLVARISFRAVCRVLSLLAFAPGPSKSAPALKPSSIGSSDSRSSVWTLPESRASPSSQAPFTNGLIWLIDISIGLGAGKILAVLAFAAQHHHLTPGAPALQHAHCSGCPWPTPGPATRLPSSRALDRPGGPPSRLPQRRGSELHKAVALLDEQGLASPCIDDISHAAAGHAQAVYQASSGLRELCVGLWAGVGKAQADASGVFGAASVRTKARFMHVHRLCSPGPIGCSSCRHPGGPAVPSSPTACQPGSTANLRASSHGFKRDAKVCLPARRFSKPRGSSQDTLAQCEPLIEAMPSAALRLEFALS